MNAHRLPSKVRIERTCDNAVMFAGFEMKFHEMAPIGCQHGASELSGTMQNRIVSHTLICPSVLKNGENIMPQSA